jgi:hypothetical protein
MRRIVRAAVAAVVAPGLAVCITAPATAQLPPPKKESELVAAGYKPMSGSQIAKALTGNTAYFIALVRRGANPPGNTVKVFHRDAKVRISIPTQGPNAGKKLESNWWIEGDHYCAENQLANIGHNCYSLFEVDSSIYPCIRPGGECDALFRIVPGNPENI